MVKLVPLALSLHHGLKMGSLILDSWLNGEGHREDNIPITTITFLRVLLLWSKR